MNYDFLSNNAINALRMIDNNMVDQFSNHAP